MVCVSAQTVEYAQNSCYIDSLLFAMFATPSTLEKSFLESQRSGGSSKLQQTIKNTFVGQIRNPKGRVSRDDMSNIRKLVISLSAEEGRSFLKEDQELQQQDAGEFFEFISECLGDDSSKFEIERAIVHEGKAEASDSTTEFLSYLPLCLNDTSADFLKLDKLLEEFSTSQISVRRIPEGYTSGCGGMDVHGLNW